MKLRAKTYDVVGIWRQNKILWSNWRWLCPKMLLYSILWHLGLPNAISMPNFLDEHPMPFYPIKYLIKYPRCWWYWMDIHLSKHLSLSLYPIKYHYKILQIFSLIYIIISLSVISYKMDMQSLYTIIYIIMYYIHHDRYTPLYIITHIIQKKHKMNHKKCHGSPL